MDAVGLIRLALQVLADRVLSLLSLAMSCFLCAWVMYEPSWHRVAALGIFSLLAYLLVRRKESNRGETVQADG